MKKEISRITYEIDKPLQMVKMATILKNHIVRNKLYVPIAGKNYVMVEGWQFAGGMMGLYPRIVKVENITSGKWLAQAEIINKKTGEVMSIGYAICSKEETKKKTFDEYAILSMAQTRAIGKAYRNLIGWVMKMAGYESTPAEEIKKEAVKTEDNGELATEPQKTTIENLCKEMGAKDPDRAYDLVEKVSGIGLHMSKLTKADASHIIASLLKKQVDKNK